jgi:hypothetical protein
VPQVLQLGSAVPLVTLWPMQSFGSLGSSRSSWKILLRFSYIKQGEHADEV